jgi:hypothetical protein
MALLAPQIIKSSRFLYLDSRDMTTFNGTANSDMYINFKESISVNNDTDILMELIDFQIPNSLYNIDKTNNQFAILFIVYNQDEDVEYKLLLTYVIAPSYYTATELETYLNTPDTNNPIYVTVMDMTNQIITTAEIVDVTDAYYCINFTYDDNANKFYMMFEQDNLTQYTVESSYTTIVSKYSDVMGWNYNTLNQWFPIHPSTTTYYLTDQVELIKTKNIYIRLQNILTTNITSQDLQRGNIFARIMMNVDYLDILYFQSSSNRPAKLESKTLKELRIQLVDDSFNLIDLQGCNWSATFYVSFVYNRSKTQSIVGIN